MGLGDEGPGWGMGGKVAFDIVLAEVGTIGRQ